MAKVRIYISSHIRACLFSLGRMLRTPLATFLTVAVIGIALALPSSLYVMLKNAAGISKVWGNSSTQISLYLQTRLSQRRSEDLLRQLRANPQISSVSYISPQQGLREFAKVTGSEKTITSIQPNPLPGVILVQPILSLTSPLAIGQLISSLQRLPEVNMARLDLHWLQRFNSIVALARSIVSALAFLLGIGVLLIVGNTIRLATQNERREIAVLKLVGATDAFIRRPFLYAGVWYGLFGGILAGFLVDGILWWLREPAANLASAYSSNFYLRGLSTHANVNLLIISSILGLVGALVVVNKNLRALH